MIEQPDTGGPASEMTLLDEFARESMIRAIDQARIVCKEDKAGNVPSNVPDKAAKLAYTMAASMVAEKRRREASGGQT